MSPRMLVLFLSYGLGVGLSSSRKIGKPAGKSADFPRVDRKPNAARSQAGSAISAHGTSHDFGRLFV